MQVISKCRRGLMPMFLLFAGVLALIGNPRIGSAEISVDSYCQLSIENMQQEVSNMQELIAVINQYKDDPTTLSQEVATKQAQFDQARDALFNSFGTTAEEYVSYMGKNGKVVNEYLHSNPDIKQQIDYLSAKLKELSEQEQSLIGGDEPPPPPGQ